MSNAVVSELQRRLDIVTDVAYELMSHVSRQDFCLTSRFGIEVRPERLLEMSNALRMHGAQRMHSHAPVPVAPEHARAIKRTLMED